ncbi:4Fe-4S dicluster domain-containing protein [Lentibacillus cibarius]|uniref:4Fe-4S dicluster domain-containing protein n=1 Tax=Lentibacillus cibarius TaxID=2583219 RepID=A0A5S3QNY6_9BACI|nr:4Fe-4S dicluster domain-containing protein [Lentibacillus cibarius]TMN22226.1 4Fe-4S dicluster domain-containing protein [Lentibacillus cibarius]
MSKMGMVIDLNRCIGCQTCVMACKVQNNVPDGMLWNRVLTMTEDEEVDGVEGTYPYVSKQYVPVSCQHCENAPCVKVCPVEATYKDENGRVLIDYDRCIGCRYCMAACPYNVRVFRWEEAVQHPNFKFGDGRVPERKVGIVEKCTMCKELTDDGQEPRCVQCCPAEARIFGDLDDPDSKINTLIRDKNGEVLLKDKGTKPQVYYLGLNGGK